MNMGFSFIFYKPAITEFRSQSCVDFHRTHALLGREACTTLETNIAVRFGEFCSTQKQQREIQKKC